MDSKKYLLIGGILIFILTSIGVYSYFYNQISKEDNTSCQISNCHGLDIQCGELTDSVMCTEMYEVGDKCRVHAKCQRDSNGCAFKKSNEFIKCENCVNDCKELIDTEKIFDCESKCE